MKFEQINPKFIEIKFYTRLKISLKGKSAF